MIFPIGMQCAFCEVGAEYIYIYPGQKHTVSSTFTSDNNIQIRLTEAGGRMSSKLISSG